jgi:hypothetical protein
MAVGPNDVPFTQYRRPHGRQQSIWITRSAPMAALARQVLSQGYHFDAEELVTGDVSLTVEPDDDGRDEFGPIAHVIVPNGPDVPNAVDFLVTSAAEYLKIPV